MVIHGGDVYENRVSLDFSVNVNPLGIPEKLRQAMEQAVGECCRYPDPRTRELRERLGKLLGVEKEQLLCGNGASELICGAVRAIRPGRTLLPVPSFYGYERAVSAQGGELLFYELKREEGFALTDRILPYLSRGVELLILANPNNPTGREIPPELLAEILQECKKRKIRVLLDECFLGFCGDGDRASCLSRLERFPELMVLQAYTKLFAIPGVRLGYLACADPLLRGQIADQLPEWNISLIAQRAGEAVWEIEEYLEKSRALIKRERAFLREQLQGLGIWVGEGSANYLLLYTGLPLYGELQKRGILIRDCSDFSGLGRGYYRIAVRNRPDNLRLLEEIRAIRDGDMGFDPHPQC